MAERALLAISGSVHGGLFVVGPDGIEQLDDVDTMGFAVDSGGARVARIVRGWSPDVAELLIYDEHGLVRYVRLDGIVAPHGIAWDGAELLIVSSGTNELVRLSATGERIHAWQAGGVGGDAWHLNCLARRGDEFVLSAAGISGHDGGWHNTRDEGIIVTPDGPPIVRGLHRPHHPYWIDNSWVVCESAAGRVSRFDPQGQPLGHVDLGAWTRGLAADDDHLYVGLSTDRMTPGPPTAALAVLKRDTLLEVDRLPVPAREVWEVAWLPPVLAGAVARGYVEGGAMALAAGGKRALLTTADVQIDPSEVQTRLTVTELPQTGSPGASLTLSWQLENLGTGPLSPIGSFPLRIGVRWTDETGVLADHDRATLPTVVHAGETATGTTTVVIPPDAAGCVTLTVSLLQELAWWLVDHDPAHGLQHALSIAPLTV